MRVRARWISWENRVNRLKQTGKGRIALSAAESPGRIAGAGWDVDDCGAFRLLVDLLDEFQQFGVILSIESLPLPKIGDQFTHVSADLARFGTLPLQTFTWDDTMDFLAQEPESFGANWASMFRKAGGNILFSTTTASGTSIVGNNNNVISNNNIGPAGTNLPIKCITGMGTAGNNTVVIAGGLGNATAQATTQVMSHFLNRLPTVTIREGHRVKVYLTSDLELPAYDSGNTAAGSSLTSMP